MVHGTVQRLSRGDTPTRAQTFPGLHTPANYCSLINQHILISCTRVQSRLLCMCVYVGLCACSLSESDGMDLSEQHTHAGGQKHTHCLPLLSWACITSEECLQREFCVLTGLHENTASRKHTHAYTNTHTASLLPPLNLWLHTTKRER